MRVEEHLEAGLHGVAHNLQTIQHHVGLRWIGDIHRDHLGRCFLERIRGKNSHEKLAPRVRGCRILQIRRIGLGKNDLRLGGPGLCGRTLRGFKNHVRRHGHRPVVISRHIIELKIVDDEHIGMRAAHEARRAERADNIVTPVPTRGLARLGFLRGVPVRQLPDGEIFPCDRRRAKAERVVVPGLLLQLGASRRLHKSGGLVVPRIRQIRRDEGGVGSVAELHALGLGGRGAGIPRKHHGTHDGHVLGADLPRALVNAPETSVRIKVEVRAVAVLVSAGNRAVQIAEIHGIWTPVRTRHHIAGVFAEDSKGSPVCHAGMLLLGSDRRGIDCKDRAAKRIHRRERMPQIDRVLPDVRVIASDLVAIDKLPGNVVGEQCAVHEHIRISCDFPARAGQGVIKCERIPPRAHRADEEIVVGAPKAGVAEHVVLLAALREDHEVLKKGEVFPPPFEGLAARVKGGDEVHLGVRESLKAHGVVSLLALDRADCEERAASPGDPVAQACVECGQCFTSDAVEVCRALRDHLADSVALGGRHEIVGEVVVEPEGKLAHGPLRHRAGINYGWRLGRIIQRQIARLRGRNGGVKFLIDQPGKRGDRRCHTFSSFLVIVDQAAERLIHQGVSEGILHLRGQLALDQYLILGTELRIRSRDRLLQLGADRPDGRAARLGVGQALADERDILRIENHARMHPRRRWRFDEAAIESGFVENHRRR